MSEYKMLPMSVGEFFIENGIDGYPRPEIDIDKIHIRRAKIDDLYKFYLAFCKESAYKPLSKKELKDALVSSGFPLCKEMRCNGMSCTGFQFFVHDYEDGARHEIEMPNLPFD